MHWSRDTEPKHPHCRHQWPITGNGNKRPAVATPMHRSSIRPTVLAVTNVNFSKPRQNLSATPAQFSDSASNTHSTSVSRTEFGEQQPPKNAHFLPTTQQVRIPCNDYRSWAVPRSKLAKSVLARESPTGLPLEGHGSGRWPRSIRCFRTLNSSSEISAKPGTVGPGRPPSTVVRQNPTAKLAGSSSSPTQSTRMCCSVASVIRPGCPWNNKAGCAA